MGSPTTYQSGSFSGDAWDKALLSQSASTLPLSQVSPQTAVEPSVSALAFDFGPDKSITVASPLVTATAPLPITRLSLIPTVKQSQVPALPMGHALVPLSGVLVATLAVFGLSVIPLRLPTTVSLPTDLTATTVQSLVFDPLAISVERVREEASVAHFVLREQVVALGDTLGAVLTQPVVDQVAENQNTAIAAVGAVSGVGGLLDSLGNFISWLGEVFVYYRDLIITNWKNFWYGEPAVTSSAVVDNEALRAQIKAEVLAELRGDLSGLLNTADPAITTTAGGQGLVVVPQSQVGDKADATAKIKSLFSDPVLVDFDNSGQSGVITPLFGNTTGENYMFVLTPINSQ